MSQTPSGLTEDPTEVVLQSLLAAYQLEARVTDRVSLCGSWDEPEPDASFAWFHLVESGSCLIEADCLPEPLLISAGQLLVFPMGAAHRLCTPNTQSPAACTLLCGEFHFAGSLAKPLLASLPPYLHLGADVETLGHLSQILRRESGNPGIGSRALMNKLSDVLFVVALRHHLQSRHHKAGLLAALTDPRIAPALALMHAEPGSAWTVEALAAKAHLSRAAFAQRFTELLGEPPMRYLTRWRMQQAALRMRDPRASVGKLAGELGFETEAAFRRAFKRIHGQAPGALRKSARAATES